MDKYEILWDRIWKNNDEKTIAIVEIILTNWNKTVIYMYIYMYITFLFADAVDI